MDTVTYYMYSDEGLIAEFDDAGNVTKTYGYALGAGWTTAPLYQKDVVSGNYYWYLNDHLGTPQKMIDSTGSVVWSAVYDSFGYTTVDGGSIITNNLRFPGQYYDAETGLHYNWNRYYDPQLGRYLRTDPLGLDGGINLYVYVKNNPLLYIDPEGLTWERITSGFSESMQQVAVGLKNTPSVAWDNLSKWSGYSTDKASVWMLGVDGMTPIRKNSLPSGGRIAINGIRGLMDPLQHGYDAILYTPSNGTIADLFESFQQIVAGPGSWAKSAAPILDKAAASGGIYEFTAFSQGGLQFGQSLTLTNNDFSDGSRVKFVNTPFNPISAHLVGYANNLEVDYKSNPRDIVSAIGNPWLTPTATTYLPIEIATGFKQHSDGAWD